MLADFHLKYRPRSFDTVLGQDAAVKSLRAVLEAKSSRSLIFYGPSGVGKTTLARIVAAYLGCTNPEEINAASNTGIDSMREVAEKLEFCALGESSVKVVILDEAHALSKQAWQSLLKPIEEPPKHVYWILCTTEPAKVPEAIRSRCTTYRLDLVPGDLIFKLLTRVNKKEGLEVADDILDLVVQRAEGSPRLALTGLAQVATCASRKEAAEVLKHIEVENQDVINVCRALMKGTPRWMELMKLVEPLRGQNPEGLRIVVSAYFTTVALSAKQDAYAGNALAILDAFSEPYPPSTNLGPFLLSLGELVLSNENS